MAQAYLITYVAVYQGQQQYGMDTTEDQLQWLEDTQEYKETYFIVNSIPITKEQVEKYHGALKGM